MEIKLKKTVTTEASIYYNEDEIMEMLVQQSGLKGGEVIFDEDSCGGIRGCWVKQKIISIEDT